VSESVLESVESIGAPSPVDAWSPARPAPAFLREPLAFLIWLRKEHSATLADSPVYLKAQCVAYSRRRRAFQGLRGDILLGLFFGVIALGISALVMRYEKKAIPLALPMNIFTAAGAVYIVSLLLCAPVLAARAGRFIKTSDKAMIWEQLALTPLREEHYLWGWLWSPLIERARHVVLAVAFVVAGVAFARLELLIPQEIRGTAVWWLKDSYVVFKPWHYGLLGIAVFLLALAGMITTVAIATLAIGQTLNIGPRLFDVVAIGFSAIHIAPLAAALCLEFASLCFLITGLINDVIYLFPAIAFGFAALVLGVAGAWMNTLYVLEDFWPALLARREVRGQRALWLSLFTSPKP